MAFDRLRRSTAGSGQRRVESWARAVGSALGIKGDQWNDSEAGGASTRFNRNPDGSLRPWTSGGVFDSSDHGKSAFDLFDKLSQNAGGGGGPDTNLVSGDLTNSRVGGTLTHTFGTNVGVTFTGLSNLNFNAPVLRFRSTDIDVEPDTPTAAGGFRFRDGDSSGYNTVRVRSAANNLESWDFTLPAASPVQHNSVMRFDSLGNADFVTLGFEDIGGQTSLHDGYGAVTGNGRLRTLGSADGTIAISIDGSGYINLQSVTAFGRGRGTYTQAGGASVAWPTINDGTQIVGTAFENDDRFTVNVVGGTGTTYTITDGTTPVTVEAGDILCLIDDANPTATASWIVKKGQGANTDTNIVTQSLTKTDSGNLTHGFNNVSMTFDNLDNFTVNANSIGLAVTAGSAFAIDDQRTVNFGGYANGSKNGVPTVATGMDGAGNVVTFLAPPIGFIKHRIQALNEVDAGTNITLAGDPNWGVITNGNLLFDSSTLASTAAIAADPYVRVLVDGSEATFETSFTSPHLNLIRTADGVLQADRIIPDGTVIEFVVPRYA